MAILLELLILYEFKFNNYAITRSYPISHYNRCQIRITNAPHFVTS